MRNIRSIGSAIFTCEPVISEACFLIARGGGDPDDLLELVSRGLIELCFDLGVNFASVRELMHQYRDTPISLADACLVGISEQFRDCRVVTVDSDFTIYRRFRNQPIPALIP